MTSNLPGTSNSLAKKLSRLVDLDSGDHAIIAEWCQDPIPLAADRHFARQGERRDRVGVLLSGWACRYKMLPDGSRQIVAFLMPGDMCDVHALVVGTAAHDVVTLTDTVMATVTPEKLFDGMNASPNLARAWWSSALVDGEIAYEWLLNVGQRSAITRVAHLFCELWWRADRVGLASATSFSMPLTQTELGDALGLTSVHVNRMLRDLRRMGLMEIVQRQAVIPDIGKLASLCGFEPDYLQTRRRSEQLIPYAVRPLPTPANISQNA